MQCFKRHIKIFLRKQLLSKNITKQKPSSIFGQKKCILYLSDFILLFLTDADVWWWWCPCSQDLKWNDLFLGSCVSFGPPLISPPLHHSGFSQITSCAKTMIFSPCSMLKTDSAIKKNKKLWNPLKLWIIRKPFLSSLIWRSLEMESKCFNQTFKTTVYYVISTPWLIYFFSWPMTSSHSPWMHKFYLPTQV